MGTSAIVKTRRIAIAIVTSRSVTPRCRAGRPRVIAHGVRSEALIENAFLGEHRRNASIYTWREKRFAHFPRFSCEILIHIAVGRAGRTASRAQRARRASAL